MSAPRVRRLLAGAAVGALLTGSVLAGCARPDLDADRARVLQGDVLAVTQAVADGRLDAAAVLLDQVRRGAADAHDAGDVSDARYASVTAALDDVAAQLEAGLAAEAAAAQAQAAAEQDAAVAAAVAQAAADAAAREAAAREAAAQEAAASTRPVVVEDAPAAPAPPGHDKGREPPGKDKGKGKGPGG